MTTVRIITRHRSIYQVTTSAIHSQTATKTLSENKYAKPGRCWQQAQLLLSTRPFKEGTLYSILQCYRLVDCYIGFRAWPWAIGRHVSGRMATNLCRTRILQGRNNRRRTKTCRTVLAGQQVYQQHLASCQTPVYRFNSQNRTCAAAPCLPEASLPVESLPDPAVPDCFMGIAWVPA